MTERFRADAISGKCSNLPGFTYTVASLLVGFTHKPKHKTKKKNPFPGQCPRVDASRHSDEILCSVWCLLCPCGGYQGSPVWPVTAATELNSPQFGQTEMIDKRHCKRMKLGRIRGEDKNSWTQKFESMFWKCISGQNKEVQVK